MCIKSFDQFFFYLFTGSPLLYSENRPLLASNMINLGSDEWDSSKEWRSSAKKLKQGEEKGLDNSLSLDNFYFLTSKYQF